MLSVPRVAVPVTVFVRIEAAMPLTVVVSVPVIVGFVGDELVSTVAESIAETVLLEAIALASSKESSRLSLPL